MQKVLFMEQSLTIYKASAGSGKTFALAVEYIAGLMQPHAEHEFEHTLAVTFTNKATAEMKSRILETLYGLKMQLKESKPYLESLQRTHPSPPIKGGSVAVQAGKALSAILHDYSHFRVETIDSFFQSILRNMARELGLAANLQVELSHEEIIESAVDSLIETMDSRPEVRRWVLDCVREQLDSGDKWDIVTPLKAFAGNIFSEAYQQRSEQELAKISDAKTVGDFKKEMYAIREKAERDVAKAVGDVMELIEDFDIISYGKNLRSFLTKALTMESDGPTKTIEQLKFKKPYAREDEVKEAYARLLAVYPVCRSRHFSATLVLQHLSSLLLLEHISRRAHEIEGDAGRFTLSSTPALLSKMIEGSDAPFIFEKIGTHINSVMIDEFQDTSRMQWENFKTLLFEKLASGGKGLLVGDIKQSIYRWRGGDWKILYDIEGERQFQRYRIERKPLDTNYRSQQVVVDFNNAFFPEAAKRLDGIAPEAEVKLQDIYSDVRQKKKKETGKGYVRVKLFKSKGEESGDTVGDMVEQMRLLHAAGQDFSQMAILVRKRRMAQQIIQEFAQLAPDIPLVSDEAFLLGASVSVQMLVAAMRVLVAGKHTELIAEKYLMFHYRRDVLGLSDTSLHSIAVQDMEQVLPEEFTACRDELTRLPLYLLAERLWRIFSLSSIPGEDIYVLTFFDELQNYLRSAAASDIQSFLTAWDETLHASAIPGSAVAGVRILTIHKSKGLEFPTVFLPFCEWKTEAGQTDDILWCQTDVAPFGELGSLPISSHSKRIRSSVFSPCYEEEHLQRRVDALNTLYVAFTRAGDNLYIYGETKPADKVKLTTTSTAADLIYLSLRNNDNDPDEACFFLERGTPFVANICASQAEEEQGVNRLRIAHRMEDAAPVKVVTRNPALFFRESNQAEDYMEQMKAEGGEVFPLRLSQRETGKRMHEVLSRIDDASQLDDVLAEAQRDGTIGVGEDWEAITSHIRQGFAHPLVASWFKAGNTVYNECAIAGIDPKSGQPSVLRPDRVVLTSDGITVVDYKFGHRSSIYRDQVNAYMKRLREMYPDCKVQGYLWYIMAGGPVKV